MKEKRVLVFTGSELTDMVIEHLENNEYIKEDEDVFISFIEDNDLKLRVEVEIT